MKETYYRCDVDDVVVGPAVCVAVTPGPKAFHQSLTGLFPFGSADATRWTKDIFLSFFLILHKKRLLYNFYLKRVDGRRKMKLLVPCVPPPPPPSPSSSFFFPILLITRDFPIFPLSLPFSIFFARRDGDFLRERYYFYYYYYKTKNAGVSGSIIMQISVV